MCRNAHFSVRTRQAALQAAGAPARGTASAVRRQTASESGHGFARSRRCPAQPGGSPMAVTRRRFFKTLTGASVGTAVGALTALGADLTPKQARAQELRIAQAKVTPSICCYCSVGCGLLVHTVDDQIVNIEGNPASPINYGNLCPKGAAVFQLHVNPNRLTKVLHRRPGGTEWEEMELGPAMDRVAELVKQARDESFVEKSADG